MHLSYLIVGSGYRAKFYARIAKTYPALFSALFLHEPLGAAGIVGAVLIIGSALVSEIEIKRRQFDQKGG